MDKKRIAIFGAGNAGKYLYDELNRKKRDYEVIGFMDNYLEGNYQGVSIYRPEKYFELLGEKTDAVFLAAGAQKTLKLMIDTCRRYMNCELYMMHDIAGKCRLPLFDGMEILPTRIRRLRFSNEKPTIPYFEVPITDNCNLNCKGCLFASNIVSGEQYISLPEIQKDAGRMAELFYDVPWIRILGGEPLMHPDLIGILKCYRENFPDSEIDLCTNGLLIPRMEEEFWQCIRKQRISIHVSGYKPTYHILEKIDTIMSTKEIPYVILKRNEFVKYYTDSPTNDMEKSFVRCIASGCYELYRGRLSSCSAVIAFEKFNEMFGASYQIMENEDWFDIHNPQIDIWKVTEALGRASRMCRYCSDSVTKSFPWEYSGERVTLNDYLI